MKTLDLVLKAKWYCLIEQGIKKEEYREIKPYWLKRLMKLSQPLNPNGYTLSEFDKFKHFDNVRFHYGYTDRTMTFECLGITIGLGKEELGAPHEKNVFKIKLGKRIK